MDFEASSLIDAQLEAVWPVLVDVEKWPEWTASMSTVTRLGTGPLQRGSKVRIKQPKLPATVWRVTEFEPGSSFSWEASSVGVTTVAWHRLVTEADRRTRVTVGICQRGPVGWLIGRLTSSLTRRYLAMEVEGLRRRCTTG